MSDRFQAWADQVVKQMRFPWDRAEVRKELLAHLEDRERDYIDQGLPEDEAQQRALAAMGDPVATGRMLDKIHRPWLGWVWTVSRLLLLAVCFLCFRMACEDPRFSLSYFHIDPYEWPNWGGCYETCGYPPFACWVNPPEVETTPIMPGAVEQAGVYTLTLDHGSWVEAEDQQWVVLCFLVRAESILDLAPFGFGHRLLAEDDLGTPFREVHLGTSAGIWYTNTRVRAPYMHLMLTIPDGEPRQWARFYVPGTDFDITVDREGRVLPWPKQED